MKGKRTFIYGAGGHGKVVADILLACGDTSLAGFVDDNSSLQGTELLGLPVVGTVEWLWQEAAGNETSIVLGIGDNRLRQIAAQHCLAHKVEVRTAVHPTATIARSALLGQGTVVMAHAVINPDARVGQGVIVNTGAVLEHDVVINDFAHVSPNATLGGAARLGRLSHLGLGAIVLPGISIGAQSIVGAGSVVVKGIPDNVVAMGTPARIHRLIQDKANGK
ncbi:MAG: acetyltransferase [Pyrinomonadaceae bacterium]